MRARTSTLTSICMAISLCLLLTFTLAAKDKAPKMKNVQGKVHMIDKGTSAITVAKGNIQQVVVFSGETKFVYGHSDKNKPGASDQVKDGYYISCAGMMNPKNQLVAKECVYRETK